MRVFLDTNVILEFFLEREEREPRWYHGKRDKKIRGLL